MNSHRRFADRLGVTYHRSPLLMKVRLLMDRYPTGASCPLGWLLDVANARGFRVISRVDAPTDLQELPLPVLSNEEVVAGICLLEQPDEVQALRAAAQIISAGGMDRVLLSRLIVSERLQCVLRALAYAALQVDQNHADWKWIVDECGLDGERVPLLHWTRLAEPIPDDRHVASGKWRLVA